jgi:hypothetical protein
MNRPGLPFLLGLVSVIALVAAIASSIQSSMNARCQATVTEQLVSALRERTAAAANDRDADRAESRATTVLIQTVFSAKSRTEIQAAYKVYEANLAAVDKQRDEAERQRRDHPLPDLPSQTCR